ncbi:MAG TPA: hypothetical protein VLC09_20940, partial [Polyangiaceae bacterium]|nr:hypothetical protein [Polyangiaceae bacterium]
MASALLAFVFVCLVLRFGWISDDGFITSRTWDNAFNGFGWVLNRGHRVQTFTSPLFMLLGLPIHALTRDPYWSLMGVNLVCVAGLLLVIAGGLRDQPIRTAFVFLGLSLSPSVLAYATSGLENSLGFLLVAAFAFVALGRGGRSSASAWTLAALLVLTRQDYFLLVAPALGRMVWREPRTCARNARWALALLVGWFGFALAYYGFLFPNTAYAKLNVAIPLAIKLRHGLGYLLDVATRDIVVIVVLGTSAAFAVGTTLRAPARALLMGVVLYVLYVVGIGGDF